MYVIYTAVDEFIKLDQRHQIYLLTLRGYCQNLRSIIETCHYGLPVNKISPSNLEKIKKNRYINIIARELGIHNQIRINYMKKANIDITEAYFFWMY